MKNMQCLILSSLLFLALSVHASTKDDVQKLINHYSTVKFGDDGDDYNFFNIMNRLHQNVPIIVSAKELCMMFLNPQQAYVEQQNKKEACNRKIFNDIVNKYANKTINNTELYYTTNLLEKILFESVYVTLASSEDSLSEELVAHQQKFTSTLKNLNRYRNVFCLKVFDKDSFTTSIQSYRNSFDIVNELNSTAKINVNKINKATTTFNDDLSELSSACCINVHKTLHELDESLSTKDHDNKEYKELSSMAQSKLTMYNRRALTALVLVGSITTLTLYSKYLASQK